MAASRDPLDVLTHVFGHRSFRGSQEDVVRHVAAGNDAVVLFPTGAGKSVCFQVPALARPGTGLVVSPLIALMEDQVRHLRQAGVKAEALNSNLSAAESARVRSDFLAGRLDMLYVSPERALMDSFLDMVVRTPISLLAIDEAHCVSSWGHDFRPEYMQLKKLWDRLPGVPRIALTATADPQTREDLRRRLELEHAKVFATSFDRPNISYTVVEKDDPKHQLKHFLRRHKGSSGIVYCLSRKSVEKVSEWLNKNGTRSRAYHAGMSPTSRAESQKAFIEEEGLVLVATIAFGMGIDKPDVRFVAHLDLPSSVEAYYQETGRAGRDGLPSDAWMTYGLQDVVMRRQMIEKGNAPEGIKRVERAKLNSLLGIAETAGCRRSSILAHFGESHAGNCGNCDNCVSPVETWDGKLASQKLLSAVYRTGSRFGTGHVVDVLRGKSSEKVVKFGHDQLPTFGVGKDMDEKAWGSVIRQLVAANHLMVNHEQYGALAFTETSRSLLKGEIDVRFREDSAAKQANVVDKLRSERKVVDIPEECHPLLEALKAERNRLAKAQAVPAYVVFDENALRAMAVARPATSEEFLAIPGVGDKKLEKYGDIFLAVVRQNGIPAPAM
jgi:ATP-dependent DNA helicase RecQ